MAQNKSKLFSYIAAGLFLLVCIFSLLKIYVVSAGPYSESGSLFDMEDGLATFACIMLILVAIGGLVTALLGKLKISMILAIVEFVIFIIAFFVCKGKFNAELGIAAALASFHISFVGWLHMILTIGAFVLSLLGSKE